MEREKVIETIRLLTQKTVQRGCTEAEALAAAQKVGELLQVYNLGLDQVFLDQTKCITVTIPTGISQRRPINRILVALADHCDCKCWFSYGKSGIEYNFFGIDTDTQLAEYLYRVIDAAIETATANFKQSPDYLYATTHRKRLSTSFQHGMAREIALRLMAMTAERKKNEVELCPVQASTGTSLVVIKQNKVENEFEKLGLGIRKVAASVRSTSHEAYRAGIKEGQKVNLSRPVTGSVAGYLK